MKDQNNYRVLDTCSSCNHSVISTEGWSDSRHCNILRDRPKHSTPEYFAWLKKTQVDDSGVCDKHEG